MTDHMAQMRDAAAALRDAESARADMQRQRDAAFLAAYNADMSWDDMQAALGLSRGALQKIRKKLIEELGDGAVKIRRHR